MAFNKFHDKIIGSFKNGERNGYSEQTWTGVEEGSIIKGEFKDGEMNGFGVWILVNKKFDINSKW